MVRANHLEAIAQLSDLRESLQLPRLNAWAYRAMLCMMQLSLVDFERVIRGAYRMIGAGSSYTDELAAIWKLTAPENFSYERMRSSNWDGIVIGGRHCFITA